MKAAVLENYGKEARFKIKEMPGPGIGKGEILIRNMASSVNPVDALVKKGSTKLVTGIMGDHIIGADFCGTIIQSKSKLFKEGEDVYGFRNALKGGAYAEEVVASENQVAHKPANLSYTEAAVLPLVACTAWQGMLYDGKLKPSDQVLINGCTGGVGMVAVQIAKHYGNYVTGVCSSKHLDFARELGCDHVICYDEEDIPLDENYDLFFDAAGKYNFSDVKGSMVKHGRFISTRGGAKNIESTFTAAKDLLFNSMKIVRVKPDREDLSSLKELCENGKLKSYIAQTFPISELDKAFDMIQNESFKGKIAVEIA